MNSRNSSRAPWRNGSSPAPFPTQIISEKSRALYGA